MHLVRLFQKAAANKILFFLIFASIILGLNLTPMIKQWRHAPPGRTFSLVHNNAQDFFFYQSLLNEGGNGELLTRDPFTSEQHRPSLIFAYFLWLGKLSQLAGLPYAYTYHLARIFFAVLLLASAYYLLFLFKVPFPRLAFIFFLFAEPFMHTAIDNGKVMTVPFMYWWTGMDAIRRAAYLPHHMAGSFMLVLSVILIFKFTRSSGKKYKYLVYAGLLIPLLAFIHTPSLFILLLVLPVVAILFIAGNRHASDLVGLLAYWVIGLVCLILMVLQSKNGFPWSQYIEWERNLQFPLLKEIIPALGILFPLALIGAVATLRKRQFAGIFSACWLFVPLVFIPLAPNLNISNIRLIQGIPYLPLAILSSTGIDFLLAVIKKIINSADKKGKKILSFAQVSLPPITGLLFIVFTFPTLFWSLKDQIREFWPIFGNIYFDNRLYNAFSFINKAYPKKTIVLATFYTGNYLPSFTNTVSYIGHSGYTYNIDKKQPVVAKFFQNQMSDTEARNFMLDNKITLVFQGPEEKPIYEGLLYTNILKPVYSTEEAVVYSLK